MGEAMTWQPIETAPKDGTWVLLSGGAVEYDWDGKTKPAMVVGQYTHWRDGVTAEEGWWQFAWYDGGFYGEYEAPTHWQPLPAPPDAARSTEEGE